MLECPWLPLTFGFVFLVEILNENVPKDCTVNGLPTGAMEQTIGGLPWSVR